MKKPTTLRTLIFVLALLFNFASYSQNWVAFNSKLNSSSNENLFLKANNQISLDNPSDNAFGLTTTPPAIPNPIKKYAEYPYAGTVSTCPNDGSELPKLFLCGSNETREIDTGITNATSIVWMKRTGGCTPNTNGNCANTADNCTWADVVGGQKFIASAAGEYKVVIKYPDASVFTFYFNVYKNEVDPTGIVKTNIVRSSDGSCVIPGRIVSGGFSNLYEYSFTTNPAPNTWQESNTFITSNADTYNVFIRLKSAPDGCVFSVKNIVVDSRPFSTSLTATQPACVSNNSQGKIKVTASTLNNEYVYTLFRSSDLNNSIAFSPQKSIAEHEFTGLSAGNYTVVTTVKNTGSGTCQVKDTQSIEIKAANTLNNTSYISRTLKVCETGILEGRANGGAGGTYRYYVNYNSTGFVPVPNGKVIIDKGGSYIMRVEDLNGCVADQTFNVTGVNKPAYTITSTSENTCNPGGTIRINVSNSYTYSIIEYSINNGASWETSNFTTGRTYSVTSGTYNVLIRYRASRWDNWCQDAFTTITIGTTTALTASAGVAALPGCDPYPDYGIVRITNPQGGTPPYEYFFNTDAINGGGWTTSNVGYLKEGGPYTVSIRDKNGCKYDMTGIRIDGKPTEPSITKGPITYNCDGTATQTVLVNNGAGDSRYTFQYYIDGNPNPNTAQPNVFLNIPEGQHFITVDYNVKSASTYSNLLDENFGSGENTTSPGINTFYYCFERQINDSSQSATWCNGAPAINDGDYSVTSSINQQATNGWNWRYPVDRTSNGNDPKGRFLAVNIGDQIPVTTILYEKQINDVIPNQPIMFEFYAMNLMMPNAGKADPNLRIALVDASGTEISWFATGNIPRSSSSRDWKKYPQTAITLDPGNNTTLRLIVRSNVQATEGNDVAIDDIKVFQVPRVCGAQFKWDFTITPPPPFIAHVENVKGETCFGAKDGSFDIFGENFTGEFYYSINNQEPWIKSTTDRVTIGPLSAATYSVRVRKDPTSMGCDFDIPTTVTSPAKLRFTVSATTATCSQRAVVTATSIEGGTSPYNLVLTNKANGATKPFNLDPTDLLYKATDVDPGNYTVTATDKNSCPADVTADITVNGSDKPEAEIQSTSNLCLGGTNGASINILITKGVGPFRYRVKRNTGQYGDYSDPFTTFTFTHNVTASGNYEFEILDLSSSCTAEVISQQIDPQIGAKTAIISALSCKQTGSEATIEVTIEGGTAPFSYVVKNTLNQQVDSGNTTNPVFQYSTSIDDTYTFEITDGHNCPISISRKVDKLVRPTATAHPHNPACFGGTGSVDLEGLEGLAPFQFDFNGSGTFKDQTNYTGLAGSAAGTVYTYKVKDANDCERSYDFKIFEPAELEGKATIDPVYNCDHPATITVSDVSGGTGARKYTLLRNNVAVVGPQDSNVFTGINVAGNYTVRITDANSCSVVINAGTVNALNAPTAMTITTTTAATCPDNKGSVTITNVRNAAGVAITGTLEYRIIAPITVGPNSTGVFNNLDANVEYTFEVRDANQCKFTDKHTIALPPTFTVEGDPGTVTCFNATDGTATFTVTGIASGTNYSYVVDSRAPLTGTSTGSPFEIDITGLTAGSHRITVTNSTTNCPIIEDVIVGGPTAALRLDTPDLTHVTCKVKGTATIHALDGSGSYTYTVTPTSPAGTAKVQVNDNIFVGLNAGEYSVSVTDLTGCTVTGQTFTINTSVNPEAEISVTSSYCAGGAGATLIATPKNAPKPNPNYEYKLNSGNYQPSGTFTGLTPGKYTITVRDIVTGCTVELAEETIETPLSASAKIDADLTCDPTSPEAIIGVTIQGGYPDYTYLVNTTGAPFTGTPIAVGTGLTKFTVPRLAGTYYFEITDNKGCKVVVSQTVNSTVKPTFTAKPNEILCKSDKTGTITITASPAGSFTYEVTPVTPAGTKLTQTTNVFENLGAGTYSVVVIDAKKCASDAQTVTIDEPLNPLTADADVDVKLTCDASNNAIKATIKVTASGGTPYPAPNLYRYSYNGLTPVISDTYSTTASGNVSVKVFDANNCEVEVTGGVTIDALNPPTAIAFDPPAAITCETGHDTTSLTLTVTNGVLPFTYEITTPTATVVTNVSSNTHTFTGLAPGHYYFKVTDANKCTVTDDFEILDVVKIQATGSIASNVTCNGLSNGSISFTVSGNRTGGYNTDLEGSVSGPISSTPTITPNPSGDVVTYTGLKGGEKYTFTVTNTVTKCLATSEVTLADPVLVQITNVTGTKVFCAPNVKTTIVVTAAGGKAPLKYAVVKDGVTPAATDFVEGNTFIKDTSLDGLDYDVYVQDGNSCPASTSISITRNDSPTIDPVTAPLCYAGAAFDITITGSVYAGSTTILYGLNGVYNTNPVKSIKGPGQYELGIKDDNGCETTTTIMVNDQLKITVTPVKDLTCAVLPPYTTTDAQFTLSAEGGVGPYTYRVSRNGGTYSTTGIVGNTFSTSQDGDYRFEATDSNTPSCSIISGIVKVKPIEPPVILSVVQSQKILCPTESTGAIKVTLDTSKGAAPFTYEVVLLDAPFTNFGSQMSGLPAGKYKVTVTDSKGCFDDEEVDIIKPDPIVVDYTVTGITCNTTTGGMVKGSIVINSVHGGTVTTPGTPGVTGYSYYVTGTNNYDESELNTDGTTSVTFNIIDFGLYKIKVVDENGCVKEFADVLVASPPSELDITVTSPPANCDTTAPGGGGGTALVKVGSAFSGTGPFYFKIYDGDNLTYPGAGWQAEEVDAITGDRLKQTTFTNLTPGVTYTYVVYDDQSKCYYYETGAPAIPTNSTLTASNVVPQNVTCADVTDGNVTFTVESVYLTATNFTYEIFDGITKKTTNVTGTGTVPAAVGGVPGTVNITSPSALDRGFYYVLIKEVGASPNQGCSIVTTDFKIDKSSKLLRIDASVDLNATCDKLGTISAIAQDGTQPYTYQAVASGNAYDPSAWKNENSFDLAGSVAGISYDIFVKDANGCIKYDTVTLLQDPIPAFTLDIVDECAPEGSFEVTVTETTKGKEPYYISVNGADFVYIGTLPYTIQNLYSGPVDVIIKDFNGCKTPVVHSPITPTPKAKAEVTTDLVCDASGAVGPNAVITVTITAGTGTADFTYAVKKGTGTFGGDNAILPAGSRTFTYPVAAGDADTYVFLIKDANGCEIETTPVAVDPIVPIVPTSTPTQPLCFGGTGTILLSATGGKGTYEYTLIRTAPTAGTLITQSVPLFENLIAGDYDYTIKDELGCIVTGSQNLGQPDELILDTPTIDQPECGPNNAPQQAKIVLAAHGGTGDYEYSFNGSDFSADTNTFYLDQNGGSQTVPYAIRDENGCPKTGSVTISWLDPPTDFDFDQPDPITCIRTNTSVEIRNVSGGIAPLTYQIVSATGTVITDNNTNPVFTNLLPGDYIFQVTDANKCIKQLKYTVKDVIKIDITEQSITHITCLGAGDGKASFLVTSFATSYDYVLDTDAAVTMTTGTIDLTGLAPGPHTITVTDNETGCPATANFTINTITTALDFTMDVTPLGCETTGAVTVTATDGWGSYTYTVTEPAPASTVLPSNTNGIFAGLTKVGVYTVTVKDANGCVDTDTFELTTPIEPVASIDATSVYCYTGSGVGQGATIVVNATTPGTPAYTPVYQYSINNGVSWHGNTFTDLAPGNYEVTVKDQYGCQAVTSVPVEIKGQIFASAKRETEIFCGPVDGLIKLEVVGGYAPFSYTVTKDGILDPTVFTFVGNSTTADYVVAGTGGNVDYVFNITDAHSCPVSTNAVHMSNPTIITFDSKPISPSCIDTQGNGSDGQILVELTGAALTDTQEYSFTLTPPVGLPRTQTNGLFTGLEAGTYSVTVSSARSCPVTQNNITIDVPAAVVAEAKAADFACTPANVIKQTIVTVTGHHGAGVEPITNFTYSNNGINWYKTNEFKVDNKSTVQRLTYYVKDLKGCISSDVIDIDPFPELISATPKTAILADCKNGGLETITVDIVGGQMPYNFEYQVSQDGAPYGTATGVVGTNTFDYVALNAGHKYQFKITDINTGCTVISSAYDVKLYDIMTVTATASKMASCNTFNDGTITINIDKYTGLYDYKVLLPGNPVAVLTGTNINAGTNNPYVITGLAAGIDYTVEVTQNAYPECTVTSDPVTITEPSPVDITAMKVDVKNQNCHTKEATITVDPTSISGGTGTYMYAFVPAGATPVDSDYQTSNIKTFATNKIAPLDYDSYDVYVRDANLCDRFQNVHISLDPLPVINHVTVANQCPSPAGYRIDVDATGLVKLQYSLDGIQYQDDNYFMVKDPGDYTVWVWDKNQCPVKANAAVTVLKPLTLEGEVTVFPTCNTSTGTVKLTAGGGTVTTPSSYIYSIDGWATDQTFNEFANLAPGNYTFSVKDIVTNCTKDVEVKIATAIDILGVTLKARPVTCNSYSTGSVSVTLAATNIDMPYTYSISGPASNPTVNITDSIYPDFNNLPAGTYTVIVKSGRGCETLPQTVEVEQPDPIEVNASFTEYACTTGTNDTNNATITVNSVTGGSGKYVRYEFRRDGILVYDGPSTTYTEKDHLGGTYIITAFDDKDCQGDNTSPIEVRSFATLLGMDFDVTPITCVTGETIRTVVDVKGTLTAQLQYTLTGTGDTVIAPDTNNTGLFQNLAIGTYLVTVLNPATGCTISQNHLVQDPNAFSFNIDATRTDICFGQADGSVVLTLVDNRPYPTNRAGEFRYTVTGPVPSSGNSTGTTLALNGLTPGRYEVAARLLNSPECDVRTTFDIAAPSTALTMNVAVGRITCAPGSNDGSLVVSADGGWPGTYQYKLDGPVSYEYSAEGNFTNLTPGRYTISVKDSNECEITDTRDFDVPEAIVFTAAATSTVLSCYGDNSGVITVSAPTGGEGANYVYSLNYTTPEGDVSVLGPQDSNVFTGLRAGTYTVTVADGFSCEATSPTTITLTNPSVIEPILSLTTGVKCTADATVTLTATGGTGPYTYSEDGTNYSAPFNSTVTFPVTLGLHKYYVQDNLGCVKISNELNIEPLTPLDIELDSRNAVVNCKGDSSAIINAVAKGGLGDYQYSLLDSTHAEVRPAQADGIFLNLPAGQYIVRVVSGDCEKEVPVTVTEAAVKLTSSYDAEPIKCFGEKTGKIVMTASGGTGAIKFAISPFLAQFVDSGTFERLEAGTYTVIVQDVLGCTEIHTIEITQPQILIANEIPNSMIPEICKGDNNGGFSIQVRGGTAPYYESLDNSKGPFNLITGNEKDYTGLAGGKHSVFIQDANGCITEVEINMPEPVVLNPTVEVIYDCVNNAQANMVIVKVDDSNSPTDVDYSLDGGDFVPSNIFTNVAPGRHTITARHSNDCRKDTETFEIDAVAEVGLIDLTNQSKDINTIVVQGTGGVAPYEYSFNGEPFTSSNSYRIYKTDNYSVVVRDKNGCIFETKVPGTFYDFCMPNYFTPNGATNTTIGPDCGALAYKELTFDIYDRYGRVVAKYRVGGKWDGVYHGSELPTGDYWYVLKLNDPKDPREFVGHFTLYR